jgi:hypothetical protein
MNKPVLPDQLTLACTVASPEAEKPIKADPKPAAQSLDETSEDFDWNNPDEDSIILQEQRATAAYRNRHGELIIRQRATWNDDLDTFVYISPENEVAFLEGLAKRAREG